MKKKIVALLLAVVMAISVVVVLTACEDDRSEVEKAIADAQKLTIEELEAKAKAEYEAAGVTFNADSLSSGVSGAMTKFQEAYPWCTDAAYNSKKGSEYQPKLQAAADANTYIADFVMIQDGYFVDSLVQQGFLLSYVPSGSDFTIAEGDQNPLVGVTFNKVFMYVNGEDKGDNYLKNIWQLTGKDGKTLKAITTVSFQSPLSEDINMNFLIMLTSPESVEKLTAAYKSYFGTDYVAESTYTNIGYKFVAEFLAQITTHSSDTSEVREMGGMKEVKDSDGNKSYVATANSYAGQDKVVFAGVAKFKDYQTALGVNITATENPLHYKNALSAAGLDFEMEGYAGFTYNMWTLIPNTAKLPYTACLFVRFLLTEAGYRAGWKTNPGYYSANTQISNNAAHDMTLDQWKACTLVETTSYLGKNTAIVKQFVTQQMNLKPAA